MKQKFRLLMRSRKKPREEILHLPKRKIFFQALRKMINLLLRKKVKEKGEVILLKKKLFVCLQLRKKYIR